MIFVVLCFLPEPYTPEAPEYENHSRATEM